MGHVALKTSAENMRMTWLLTGLILAACIAISVLVYLLTRQLFFLLVFITPFMFLGKGGRKRKPKRRD